MIRPHCIVVALRALKINRCFRHGTREANRRVRLGCARVGHGPHVRGAGWGDSSQAERMYGRNV